MNDSVEGYTAFHGKRPSSMPGDILCPQVACINAPAFVGHHEAELEAAANLVERNGDVRMADDASAASVGAGLGAVPHDKTTSCSAPSSLSTDTNGRTLALPAFRYGLFADLSPVTSAPSKSRVCGEANALDVALASWFGVADASSIGRFGSEFALAVPKHH